MNENTVSDMCKLGIVKEFNGILLRNNSGAFKDINGRWVRYGLGNDSARICEVRKSSDLVGATPMLIQPHHVGRTIAVLTAFETKKSAWVYVGNKKEIAQKNFHNQFNNIGGFAVFCNNPEQSFEALRNFIL